MHQGALSVSHLENWTPAEPPGWFVLTTHASQERRARYELSRQGFPVYLPMRAAEGREKLRFKDLPLWPGYIFAQPLPDGRWTPMRSTLGVRDLLLKGEAPARLPASAIQAIKDQEHTDGLIYFTAPKDSFKAGDPVIIELVGRVVKGKFVERPSEDNNRARVLYEALGGWVPGWADMRQLRAAE